MAIKRRTYGTLRLDRDGGRWVLDDVQPHVRMRLKAIFRKVPVWRQPPYTFPDTPEICMDLEWFLARYPFAVSKADWRRIQRRRRAKEREIETVERILLPDHTPRTIAAKGRLRDYQARAVDVFLARKRLLVGDSVGLGKTYIPLGAFLQPKTLPAIVVVEPHLPTQWLERMESFFDLRVHRIDGRTPYSLPEADIYLTKYSCVSGWADLFSQGFFRSAVFDEIQQLRRAQSQKYQAARVLARRVEYVLGLTATPIYNWAEDIFNVVDIIQEGALGTRDEFLREWVQHDGKRVKDPKALGAYLRETSIFLRRTRTEVGRELPPTNSIVHAVEYDQAAVDRIDDIARKLAMKVIDGSFVEKGRASREFDLLMRQTTGVSKARYVAAYVRVLIESGEPVVLAGWHREVYEVWLKHLDEFKPAMFTGSESPTQKEESKRRFVAGETDLLILSLRSGAGLDGLQERGSVVVFGELDWSPKIHEQLIGRLRRDRKDGNDETVTAVYLVSEEGSDPVMRETLGLKASQARDIVDPGAGLDVQHSDPKRIKRLAEQFLAGRRARAA